MKPKSTPKAAPKATVVASSATLEIQPGETVPPGFEEFVGMNQQQIFSTLAPNVKNFAAIATLLPSVGLGIEVPHWARNAAQKFWEAIGLEISPGTEPLSPSVLGKLTGMIEATPAFQDERPNSDKLHKFADHFQKLAKTEAANAKAAVSKEFFDGRASFEKTLEKMKGLSQRTKVFLVIAVAWQAVETFSSAGELHRWLAEQKAILPATDAAETRKICRLIGLKLKEKPGKPPKS